ncbi:UNVERIFIED_CONTAM: hypothetical protein Sradi_6190200 [Sesamum radiatum]|uniref:Uncharacterized protein n=1 Tax=Sesamum radiatum TaxID=300843 RepID=A0AAW2KAY1_SESRA
MQLGRKVGVLPLNVHLKGPLLRVDSKRPISPPAMVTSEGPAKRTRASSQGTPPTGSSKRSATQPPLPPIKEEKGVSSRPS